MARRAFRIKFFRRTVRAARRASVGGVERAESFRGVSRRALFCAEPFVVAWRASVWGVERAESFRGVSRRALFCALTVRRRSASKRWGRQTRRIVSRRFSSSVVLRRAAGGDSASKRLGRRTRRIASLRFASSVVLGVDRLSPSGEQRFKGSESFRSSVFFAAWRRAIFSPRRAVGGDRRVSVKGVERAASLCVASRRALFCAEPPDDENVESRQSVWRAERSALSFFRRVARREALGPQYSALIFFAASPGEQALGARKRRIVPRCFASSALFFAERFSV